MDDTVVFEATTSQLSKMMNWISDKIKMHQVEEPKGKHILLALEEAIVNIIYHAYSYPQGLLEIQVHYNENTRELEFTLLDQGKPFDPLTFNKLDITSDVEQRKPGGLGIYFMKKVTDQISYERKDNYNVLHLKNQI